MGVCSWAGQNNRVPSSVATSHRASKCCGNKREVDMGWQAAQSKDPSVVLQEDYAASACSTLTPICSDRMEGFDIKKRKWETRARCWRPQRAEAEQGHALTEPQLLMYVSLFLFLTPSWFFCYFTAEIAWLPSPDFLMYHFFIFYMGRLCCNRDKSCRNLQEPSQNGSLRHGKQQSDHFLEKCLLMSRVGAGAGPVWRYCASPWRGRRCLSVLWATFNY